jgi:ubiquinone/menaquinone biosynthesis C-methylase UbiE
MFECIKTKTREKPDNQKDTRGIDLELTVIETLKAIGIKRGQTVLDFGCGSGTYAIPAARIVGEEGTVYALDKDKKVLDDLMHKADTARLANIKGLATGGELVIGLAARSIDVVILFDVYHHYYFPQTAERKRLIEELYTLMKSDGFLAVWPKHMESEAHGDIEGDNFYLQTTYSGTLIHENRDIEKGIVMNFGKKRDCAQ